MAPHQRGEVVGNRGAAEEEKQTGNKDFMQHGPKGREGVCKQWNVKIEAFLNEQLQNRSVTTLYSLVQNSLQGCRKARLQRDQQQQRLPVASCPTIAHASEVLRVFT